MVFLAVVHSQGLRGPQSVAPVLCVKYAGRGLRCSAQNMLKLGAKNAGGYTARITTFACVNSQKLPHAAARVTSAS